MKKSLLSILLLAASGLAFAQAPAPKDPTATPGIDKRIDNQEKRIEKGVATGQLNQKEAARLENRETKAKADVAAAKADGKVTKAERKKLNRELNSNSHAIHREKHDRQHAKRK